MKKLFYILVPVLIVLFVGCSRTAAANETKATEPTSKIELITHEYVIPEGAKGPGDVPTFADTYDNYPEDKRPKETEPRYEVIYYYVGAKGIGEDYDAIEGTSCSAEDLIHILINGGVLMDGAEVVSYTQDDGENAVLELSRMEPFYEGATEEQLAQAVANTIGVNMEVARVTVKVGDKTYGPLTFKK